MDAFKLLSRSTNLKQAYLPKPNNGERILDIKASSAEEDETGGQTTGQKRKRDSDQSNGNCQIPIREGERNGVHHSAKSDSPSENPRAIFKTHKVKIVALTGQVTTPQHEQGDRAEATTRKQKKEAARLYPRPLTAFDSLSTEYATSATLSNNIQEQGYKRPTEVQLATIPLLLDPIKAGLALGDGVQEVNLLTIAPTGSGKTLAFLIPHIDKILKRRQQAPVNGEPSVLIIAPTKELVVQIVNEGHKLCQNTGVTVTAMRKGMTVSGQADILTTTPLVLAEAIESSSISLSNIHSLILDEADVLLDPLFLPQTRTIWTACTNPDLHASLWSATISSSIETLASSLLPAPLLRCIIGLKDSCLPTLSHSLRYAATEPGKLLGLRTLLAPTTSSPSLSSSSQPTISPPFLIFTQTTARASALLSELRYLIPASAGGSSRIAALHSALPAPQRDSTMTRFRRGDVWILITTDLLARGVDFRGVKCVVNYDVPTSAAAYVHRVGRAGRGDAGQGVAVTFYTRDDVRYLRGVVGVIRAAGGSVEEWLVRALPEVGGNERRELKKRGVGSRGREREGDDDKMKRKKREARIGGASGWEKKREGRRRGAVEASKRRVREKETGMKGGEEEWEGFD